MKKLLLFLMFVLILLFGATCCNGQKLSIYRDGFKWNLIRNSLTNSITEFNYYVHYGKLISVTFEEHPNIYRFVYAFFPSSPVEEPVSALYTSNNLFSIKCTFPKNMTGLYLWQFHTVKWGWVDGEHILHGKNVPDDAWFPHQYFMNVRREFIVNGGTRIITFEDDSFISQHDVIIFRMVPVWEVEGYD